MPLTLEFGLLPQRQDLTLCDLSIRTLPDFDANIKAVRESEGVERDWIFAPLQQSQDFMTGVVRRLPYSGRVFGLPKTHILSHSAATDVEHLRFLIWILGFIYGVRLTDTEAGFLDATPLKIGMLHDIVWTHHSEQKALALSDEFWRRHITEPRIAKGVMGVVHSFFISQTPTLLDFERFIYQYIALDGCYAVWKGINGAPKKKLSHKERIAFLCSKFNRSTPDWADQNQKAVIGARNDTLHEGLFFDEPLGFQVHGGNAGARVSHRNVLLEMQCLISRFLCALLGFYDASYIASDLNTRQIHGVEL